MSKFLHGPPNFLADHRLATAGLVDGQVELAEELGTKVVAYTYEIKVWPVSSGWCHDAWTDPLYFTEEAVQNILWVFIRDNRP
jgi:hypothetical protein